MAEEKSLEKFSRMAQSPHRAARASTDIKGLVASAAGKKVNLTADGNVTVA